RPRLRQTLFAAAPTSLSSACPGSHPGSAPRQLRRIPTNELLSSASLVPLLFPRCWFAGRAGFEIMTEESGRRVGGSNALTGRVLVLVLDLRVGGFLRAGHQQSGDIDDSLELAHAVKEIEHRVIGTIKFHLERQFAIKIFAIDT